MGDGAIHLLAPDTRVAAVRSAVAVACTAPRRARTSGAVGFIEVKLRYCIGPRRGFTPLCSWCSLSVPVSVLVMKTVGSILIAIGFSSLERRRKPSRSRKCKSSAHRASPAPARLRRGLGGELCDAVLESDRNPSSATQYSDTGRCTQLALNSSAGTKQIPAATRRGKNDTQSYIYGLAPGEARPTDGTMAGGRSLSMSDSLGDAVIRQNMG